MAKFVPAIVSPNTPNSDRLDWLDIEHSQIMRIYQRQVFLIKIHV